MTGNLPCTCEVPCLVELDCGRTKTTTDGRRVKTSKEREDPKSMDQSDDDHDRNNNTKKNNDDEDFDLDVNAVDRKLSREKLWTNLKRYGWSPIRCYGVGTKAPSREDIVPVFQSDHPSTDDSTNGTTLNHHHHHYDPRLTYRAAESGGGGIGQPSIEPKESLELEYRKIGRRKKQYEDDEDDEKDAISHRMTTETSYEKIEGWCLALSKIAQAVNRILDLPPNIFLVDDASHENALSMSSSSTSLPTITTTTSSSSGGGDERLDLLRVFYYHAVGKEPTIDKDQPQQQQTLGSSPHTDWGSWTVVWQDSVGGLETYCRKRHKWIPVPPPGKATTINTRARTNDSTKHANVDGEENQNEDDEVWDCIIHVGDMSSLTLGWAKPARGDDGQDIPTIPTATNGTTTVTTNSTDMTTIPTTNNDPTYDAEWPSPKHRVLSPTDAERTSLVYFAYPPASCSIRQMIKAWTMAGPSSKYVDDNNDDESHNLLLEDRRLPLSEYYLLKDQSMTSSSPSSQTAGEISVEAREAAAAEAVYNKLESLTIREAIQEKWNQVQRG